MTGKGYLEQLARRLLEERENIPDCFDENSATIAALLTAVEIFSIPERVGFFEMAKTATVMPNLPEGFWPEVDELKSA